MKLLNNTSRTKTKQKILHVSTSTRTRSEYNRYTTKYSGIHGVSFQVFTTGSDFLPDCYAVVLQVIFLQTFHRSLLW